MQAIRTIGIVLFICLLSNQALAGADGTWEFRYWNPNQDNRWIVGAAGNDKNLMVYGTETSQRAGTAPVVKRSINGGETWGNVAMPAIEGAMFNVFTDITFSTTENGFIVGQMYSMLGQVLAGPLFRFEKGGITVEAVNLRDVTECRKITCYDRMHCWVSCMEGKVVRSYDGGDLWLTASVEGADTESHPGPLHFIDESEGWCTYAFSETEEPEQEGQEGNYIVHDKGALFHTTDGGESWQKLFDGEHYVYDHIQFTSATNGYLAAHDEQSAVLRKTTDGGQNWFIQPLPASFPSQFGELPLVYIGGIHFFDDSKGWISAAYGNRTQGAFNVMKFFYTEDGAMTFQEFDAIGQDGNPLSGMINKMVFLDEHMGFGFGEFQVVVRYSDGQYEPPEDGDVPDGDVPDGDGDPDGDVDTGPVYHGGPGEPCPVPEDPSTHDYPRCDPALGSPVCAWKDGGEASCTSDCNNDSACFSLSPDACCKPVSFEQEELAICLLEPVDCVEYHNQSWKGYKGALVGEPCETGNDCDPRRTDGCLPTESPYCSKICLTDADCPGGFQTSSCCIVDGGDVRYCAYGAACGDEETDGDEPTVDGDTPVEDGDIAADGDDSGYFEGNPTDDGSGSGCASGHPAGVAGLLLVLLVTFRRRLFIR